MTAQEILMALSGNWAMYLNYNEKYWNADSAEEEERWEKAQSPHWRRICELEQMLREGQFSKSDRTAAQKLHEEAMETRKRWA